MTGKPPTAGTWARKVRPRDADLADLEAHVFARHDETLRAMGRGPRTGAEPRAVRVGLNILAVLTYVAPLFGACAFMANPRTGFDGLNDSMAILVAELCFYIGIAGPVIIASQWWRRLRSRDDFGVAVLVTNLVSVVVVFVALVSRDVSLVAGPAVPVWIVLVLTIMVLMATLVMSTGVHIKHFPRTGPADAAKIDALVARLSQAQRTSLRSARLIALNALADRDVITDNRKAEADACELGRLYTIDIRLWPTELDSAQKAGCLRAGPRQHMAHATSMGQS